MPLRMKMCSFASFSFNASIGTAVPPLPSCAMAHGTTESHHNDDLSLVDTQVPQTPE